MKKLPRIEEEDIQAARMIFCADKETRHRAIKGMVAFFVQSQPAVFHLLARLTQRYDEPWTGVLVYSVVLAYRVIEFSYSRQFPPEGRLLPEISFLIGEHASNMALAISTGARSRMNKLIAQTCQMNRALFIAIEAEVRDALYLFDGELGRKANAASIGRICVRSCAMLYQMVESQLGLA